MLDDADLSAVIASFEAGRCTGLSLDREIGSMRMAIGQTAASSFWMDGFVTGLSERREKQLLSTALSSRPVGAVVR
jgi:hypothetical protein